eukprot:169360_1
MMKPTGETMRNNPQSLNTIFISFCLFLRTNLYYLLWCNALHLFKQFYQWYITGTTNESIYPCAFKNVLRPQTRSTITDIYTLPQPSHQLCLFHVFYAASIDLKVRFIWDDNG